MVLKIAKTIRKPALQSQKQSRFAIGEPTDHTGGKEDMKKQILAAVLTIALIGSINLTGCQKAESVEGISPEKENCHPNTFLY